MRFWELRVPCTPESAEAVTNFLWELGALGVVEEEVAGHPAVLRAFYPESTSSPRVAGAAAEYLASIGALGIAVPQAGAEVHAVLEEAWASAWQASFPPRPVGSRLLLLPPWSDGGAAGVDGAPLRVRVGIEPGRAFGTGHHGSTEGCLVLLERALARQPGPRVMDIGSGTGILAIAAVQLGALRAVALDIDPDAIRAVTANARLNGCSDRIEPVLGGPEGVADGEPFELIVSNLLGPTHVALRGQYRRLLAENGVLILGGMLADDDQPVRAVLDGDGFVEVDRVLVDGWSSLALTAPLAPRSP